MQFPEQFVTRSIEHFFNLYMFHFLNLKITNKTVFTFWQTVAWRGIASSNFVFFCFKMFFAHSVNKKI
jgi:hypothetical protein